MTNTMYRNESTTPGQMDAPVIVAASRTPIGTAGRALAGHDAAELASLVLANLRRRVPSVSLREVVLGNCTGPGGDLARVAALRAHLGVEVPALTVDRQCGSGLAAIALAVDMVRLHPGLVLAGGVESASTAPWRFWPPEEGAEPVRYERAPFAPADVGDPDMGPAADALAAEYGISRARQDVYAARSHARAVEAGQAGLFGDELMPVGEVHRDERPRPGMSERRLARFPPAFDAGGTVTAGNSCGINDGAAAVAVLDAATHTRLNIPGLRVLVTATAGVDPTLPGIGLVPAVQEAVKNAGLELDDIDVIEFNEAFAGQILACCDALGVDPERICPQGGALALGHPWGASGAVLLVRLYTQLVRQGRGRFGLAAIAVGGGQGVAMLVERCL
ncbi:thiolase family protein [Haloechinothrix alba]|uniref:thiolase family protein n=1 Tax=Haloechinothrix alba TaxID=664784 RepID=UPI001FEC1CA6|nr:thiolase family protein [Haloechinothrix alba]